MVMTGQFGKRPVMTIIGKRPVMTIQDFDFDFDNKFETHLVGNGKSKFSMGITGLFSHGSFEKRLEL